MLPFRRSVTISGLASRRYRHLSPAYVIDRLRLAVHERSHPDAPWLTAEVVVFLERWLQPHHVGFEWGSGRSTMWFAQRVRQLASVEHDPRWHEEVNRQLQEKGLEERVIYRRIAVDDDAPGPSQPYVSAISEHASASLDFCLVDGVPWLRDQCALASLDKLKPGGLLVIDNANWFIPRHPTSRAPNSRGPADGYASADWEQFDQRVASWSCTWTTSGVTDTAIWIRPS